MTGFDYLDPEWLAAKPGVKWSRPGAGSMAAWVADMDFPIAEPVAAALRQLLDGGDLGYPNLDNGNPLAVPFADRMDEQHGWSPDPGRVWAFTDVLNAVQAILALTTSPGDGVAVHAPTYPPFPATIDGMARRMLPMRLADSDAGWRLEVDSASDAMAGAAVLLLVNPHNPSGRVFTRTELLQLADIAAAHDLLVIADEVHAELVYPGHTHIPFASLHEDAAARTITITSASKTFNLAGIRTAVAHFGHVGAWTAITGRPEHLWGVVSNMSVAATLAAWSRGDEWLAGLMKRLADNRAALGHFLHEHLAEVRWHAPEGTYLAWLDFTRTGLGADPAATIRDRSGVELSPGPQFGPAGEGFARLNFATAPNVLDVILERIVGAVS